jgi:hypothetical protein
MARNNQERIISEIFRAAGEFVIEGGDLPRMSGDPQQVRAIRRAALASRRFYEALCNESSTLDTVSVMLEEKRAAAAEFERVIGTAWRF